MFWGVIAKGSEGHEIYISDLTSVILPKDPLRMILPLTEEDTNISLNISLLRVYNRLLRLFSVDPGE